MAGLHHYCENRTSETRDLTVHALRGGTVAPLLIDSHPFRPVENPALTLMDWRGAGCFSRPIYPRRHTVGHGF
jgi:hypothetical protein